MYEICSDRADLDFYTHVVIFLHLQAKLRDLTRVRFMCGRPWDHLPITHPPLLSVARPALSVGKHSGPEHNACHTFSAESIGMHNVSRHYKASSITKGIQTNLRWWKCGSPRVTTRHLESLPISSSPRHSSHDRCRRLGNNCHYRDDRSSLRWKQWKMHAILSVPSPVTARTCS